MHFIPDNIYHLYNRGNNKQPIFFNERNYHFFINKLKIQISPHCEILCWCLMPNHFHLMIYATDKSAAERPSFGGKPMQELSYRLGILLSSYAQAINKQNGTTGSLFQQKTKSKCISLPGVHSQSDINGKYLTTCMHYIHQNPWKAGLVKTIEDWEFSSFREYMGGPVLLECNKEILLSLTGYNVDTFYKDSYDVLDRKDIEGVVC